MNTWKLNNAQLTHLWVKEGKKKEIIDFLKFNKNYCTTYPILGDTMEANWKAYNSKCLHQEAGKSYTSEIAEHLKDLE